MHNVRFIVIVASSLFLIPSISVSQKTDRIVREVYRVPLGSQEEKEIWIVDGSKVRSNIHPEFLYGGNGERYLYIPPNELWIDNAITAEELNYTIAHELYERNLMARLGLTYDAAHDSALAVEHRLRLADQLESVKHEVSCGKVSPADFEGAKEIPELADSIILRNIYRVPLDSRNGIAVWIVDGAVVRRDIYPDFVMSGNDLVYHFIPPREIWIDNQISCEELEFSIVGELRERELLAGGVPYDDAYEQSLVIVNEHRKKASDAARKKLPITVPKILVRQRGTGKEY